VFEFTAISGADTILGFEDGLDLISFTDSTVDFADITIVASGTDTIIDIGNGNTITLENIGTALITESDFIFV
jgi:hypothetical protein